MATSEEKKDSKDCFQWKKGGTCRFGDRCKFSHPPTSGRSNANHTQVLKCNHCGAKGHTESVCRKKAKAKAAAAKNFKEHTALAKVKAENAALKKQLQEQAEQADSAVALDDNCVQEYCFSAVAQEAYRPSSVWVGFCLAFVVFGIVIGVFLFLVSQVWNTWILAG